MTVWRADADQAHEQRRPDPARAGAAYWGVDVPPCHSEEQSDEESWAGTKKLLRLSVDLPPPDSSLRSESQCGVPMQTKRTSNGGPPLRGRARLTGAA